MGKENPSLPRITNTYLTLEDLHYESFPSIGAQLDFDFALQEIAYTASARELVGMMVPAIHHFLESTKSAPKEEVFQKNPGTREALEIFRRIVKNPPFEPDVEIIETIAWLRLRGLIGTNQLEENKIPEEEIRHVLRVYKRSTESFPEGRICAQVDSDMWRFITPLKAAAIKALMRGPMNRDEYCKGLFGKPYGELTFNEKRKFNATNGDLRAGFHLVLPDFRSGEKDEWGPEKGVKLIIDPSIFDE